MKDRTVGAPARTASRTAARTGARILRASLVAGLFLASASPMSAAAQDAPPAEVSAATASTAHADAWAPPARCPARGENADPFLAEVERAHAILDDDDATAALDALDPRARRTAEESPDDALAQYRLAAVMGARLDHQHGTDKISGADALHEQATRVLELSPGHPGASYMMGRIQASVLRLHGIKGFVARQLLGSSALSAASWEDAQALLEVAVKGAPCVPEHRFELARAYAAQGNRAGAEREVGYVRRLTEGLGGRDAYVRGRAEEVLEEMGEG